MQKCVIFWYTVQQTCNDEEKWKVWPRLFGNTKIYWDNNIAKKDMLSNAINEEKSKHKALS